MLFILLLMLALSVVLPLVLRTMMLAIVLPLVLAMVLAIVPAMVLPLALSLVLSRVPAMVLSMLLALVLALVLPPLWLGSRARSLLGRRPGRRPRWPGALPVTAFGQLAPELLPGLCGAWRRACARRRSARLLLLPALRGSWAWCSGGWGAWPELRRPCTDGVWRWPRLRLRVGRACQTALRRSCITPQALRPIILVLRPNVVGQPGAEAVVALPHHVQAVRVGFLPLLQCVLWSRPSSSNVLSAALHLWETLIRCARARSTRALGVVEKIVLRHILGPSSCGTPKAAIEEERCRVRRKASSIRANVAILAEALGQAVQLQLAL